MTLITDSLITHLAELIGYRYDDTSVEKIEKFLKETIDHYEERGKDNKKSTKKKVPPKKVDKSKIKKCEYVPTRGKNSGSLCGKEAKFECNGKWYCGIQKENDIFTGHIRTAQLLALKNKPPTKTVAPSKDPDLAAKKILKKMMTDKKTKVKVHPVYGVVYHPPTMIVVDVKKHKALGSLNDDGNVGPLSDRQKHICDINNWNYDRDNEEETQPILEEEFEIDEE